MELGHTEAIKQAVMAGLGIAFVSSHAIAGELRTASVVGAPASRISHTTSLPRDPQ